MPSMIVADYQVDFLVQGYPGKSATHGGLGWSGITLLRGAGHVALIDVGSFGQRRPLLAGLAEHGLEPAAVTDVILTHAHHDHATNWLMFANARIAIGAAELAWAVTVPPGTPVPELYVRELAVSPRVHLVEAGEMVISGLGAFSAPGHTPGHLVYVLSGTDHDVIFTGDAAKNRAELIAGKADMTHDPALTRASIEAIWDLWRQRPGNMVVPGHDVPMVLDGGRPRYVGSRRASIAAWFGDDMETMKEFDLSR
jgi:N-acyl homoserine lactone hydrolase